MLENCSVVGTCHQDRKKRPSRPSLPRFRANFLTHLDIWVTLLKRATHAILLPRPKARSSSYQLPLPLLPTICIWLLDVGRLRDSHPIEEWIWQQPGKPLPHPQHWKGRTGEWPYYWQGIFGKWWETLEFCNYCCCFTCSNWSICKINPKLKTSLRFASHNTVHLMI